MAIAKKAPTEKQIAARKKFGEQAKARAAARQNKNPNQNEEALEPIITGNPSEVEQPVIEEKDTIIQPDVGDLQRQVQELKDMMWSTMVSQAKDTGASVSTGKLTGTFEKYSTSVDRYPSPVERLMNESKLQRFAFQFNYDLDWEITVSEYETIDKVRTKEPKFSLTLIRVILDEETGEDTGGRYEICRLIMHEDPEAAMIIARDNGILVEEDDEATFLNEMRYLRAKDWLLECFYPAPIKKERNKREMVVDGKLVVYYEVNNESGRGVMKQDWDNLPKIKF